MEKEIEKEILKAQKEILNLKKILLSSIQKISENIASNIIENISGDKLNESSIKAVVEDISKKILINIYDIRCNFLGNYFFLYFSWNINLF